MAPLKQVRSTAIGPLSKLPTRPPIATRSRASVTAQVRGKRKADSSPVKTMTVKRSAFGDVTNALAKHKVEDRKAASKATVKQPIKKAIVTAKVLPSVKTVVKPKQNENLAPPPAPIANGIVTRAGVKLIATNQTAVKPKEVAKENCNRIKTRLSNEFDKTEESLYSTALEELNDSNRSSGSKTKQSKSPVDEKPIAVKTEIKKEENADIGSVSMVAEQFERKLDLGDHKVPEGIEDFDYENWLDTFQASEYAMDIFHYLKSQEPKYDVPDYMRRQVCLSPWMRSLLVDWMVEVQESFELNHETLYLAVKLVDVFLSRVTVGKDTLQLVGAVSMFIASKYDERIPPMIDDFVYVCDAAYTRKEILRMEINVLKVCDYQLGIPISYRFLRRYARCAKISMPVLTLARYALEYSLMDYATVTVRDSKLAAAALYLALQMKKISGWTPALEFYSGYKLSEIISTVHLLNNGLHRRSKNPLNTIFNKYAHQIFFEVARTPLIANEHLKS